MTLRRRLRLLWVRLRAIALSPTAEAFAAQAIGWGLGAAFVRAVRADDAWWWQCLLGAAFTWSAHRLGMLYERH